MPSAAALRIQIEHVLERRFPAALTPAARTMRETVPTGIAALDDLLDGGLPVGAISEVTGPECAGRTSLVLSLVAQRTQQGHVCAWVDAEDAFDPQSAAACGVRLKQLLWVRCRSADGPAIAAAPAKNKHWTRLDQALRATDLVLQAGGFAAVVLDLGNTTPEDARRIPLATWFRFRQAADRTRCSLVVIAQQATAQSSAAAVLLCKPLAMEARAETVISAFCCEAERVRERQAPTMSSPRKPPATTWPASGAWDREMRA